MSMKIPNQVIKKIVQEEGGVSISDSAASALARILEHKAGVIAKYAVMHAKKDGRKSVMQDDIDSYKLKFGE